MGKSKHKRAFLAEHPTCCFCGGGTPSAEPDHIPSRVLFDGKVWPEGFEFPACVKCNRATRHDEQVVAMLSRIYPDSTTEKGRAETFERIRAVAHNYPGVLREMQPTVSQLQNATKHYGIAPKPGQPLSDLPVLAVNGPLVNGAVENFARKLCCALFYKHAGAILPASAGIAVKWYSNLQIHNDEIPRNLAPFLPGIPVLARAHTKLDDQFFYRWGLAADTQRVAAFLVFFRQSFAILGYVNVDASGIALPEGARVLQPYCWS